MLCSTHIEVLRHTFDAAWHVATSCKMYEERLEWKKVGHLGRDSLAMQPSAWLSAFKRWEGGREGGERAVGGV